MKLTSFRQQIIFNVHFIEWILKEYLSEFDSAIANVEIKHGPNRAGDIPHSLANIDKAKSLLGYDPQFSMKQGLKEAVKWYWENL